MKPVKLPRRVINDIIDKLEPVNSLDKTASIVATKNVAERIRDQLVNIELVPVEDAVEKLTSYIIKRMFLAEIKNDETVGLRASEALSAAFHQLLQDAFKATDQTTEMGKVVAQMDSTVATVKDRSDQRVIAHFDGNYAKLGNFNLREVSDMRSLLVRTTVRDLLKSDDLLGSDDFEFGVMETFDGDRVSRTFINKKNELINTMHAKVFKAGIWNKLDARLNPKTLARKSLICLRLKFDIQLMYARSVTLTGLVAAIKNFLSKESSDQAQFITSSFTTGIIDILPGGYIEEPFIYETQVAFLINEIKPALNNSVSGLSKVKSMSLVEVKLDKLIISSNPVNEYYMAELGRDKLNLDMTWREIEDSIVETRSDRKVSDNEILISTIGSKSYIIPDPDSATKCIKPSAEIITNIYINVFAGKKGTQNLRVLTLDAAKIRKECIDISMILKMLEFSGITIHSVEPGRTSDLNTYIYVRSKDDPIKLLATHNKAYKYSDLFKANKNQSVPIDKFPLSPKALKVILEEGKDNLTAFLENIRLNLTDRIFKYYYAILECEKKGSGTNPDPFKEHVKAHAYSDVIRFPFVDRYKTTCNDWNTMSYVLGADGARNNYVVEPFYLFGLCDITIDPRHLELFADYVFERGVPAGAGQYGTAKHFPGTTTEISTGAWKSQLLASFNREPEKATNFAVSTLMGAVPTGQEGRELIVEKFKRMEKLERDRVNIMVGSKVLGNAQATSSNNTELALRSALISIDPYNSIPLVTTSEVINLSPPEELVIKHKFINLDVLNFVRAGLKNKLLKLKTMAPHERQYITVITLPETSIFHDMNALYTYFSTNIDIFSNQT